MSAFAKVIVSGPGARAWLDSIFANRIPKKAGRIALCHLLSKNGGTRAELTLYESAPGVFYLVSAGALERHDHDTLKKLLPNDDSVRLTPVTSAYGVLVLAGPKSREVLQSLTDSDISNEAFPWLSGQKISVGAVHCDVLRVNFVGELGYEFHHPIEMQNHLFDLLMKAGAQFGIRPFGIRAMMSMALEKSYRLVGREMSIEYSAFESGLQRFVHPNKGQFLGRDALVAWQQKGFKNSFVTMEVNGITDVDARGSEAIYLGDQVVGRCTSGGFGWRTGKSLALAMVSPDHSAVGTKLEIVILGKRYKATIIPESPFDAENDRLRG
jgi:dimethylglycine dehydrogenase